MTIRSARVQPIRLPHAHTLDILREIHQRLRYRVSLDSLGRATLDAPKSADGLDALRWFKEGRLDLIAEYCQKDVELTRDLFYFGLKENYLLFDRRNEGRMRIPLDWKLEDLVSGGGTRLPAGRINGRLEPTIIAKGSR